MRYRDFILAKALGRGAKGAAVGFPAMLGVSGGGTETTVTGVSPLVLAAALRKPVKSLVQTGVCEQASTPAPSAPVPLVCNNGVIKYGALGANLLDPSAANTVLKYYINKTDGEIKDSAYNFMFAGYMPVEAGKTYVAYGRAKNGNDLSDYNRVAWYDSTKTWIGGANYTQNEIAIVTAPANAAYARFSCNPSGGTTQSVTQEYVDSFNWTFAEGTAEITPFVPFVGGIYTDGTPEVIRVGGKNIIDIATVGIEQGSVASSDGRNSSSTYRARTAGYVPVRPSTQYTLSCVIDGYSSGASRGVFVLEYADASAAGYTGDTSGWKAPDGYTFTTGATTTYIRIVFAKGSTASTPIEPSDVSNVQLEYGSAATAYQPYSGEPQTAGAEDLFAAGDYADEQDIISGAIARKVGIYVCNGTETVSASGVGWALPIADKLRSGAFLWCSHYPYSSVSMASAPDKCIKNFGSQNIGFKDSAFTSKTDVTDFFAAQYAAGTPVIVIYPLAEETTESVTPQALHTNAGDNTITVTAEVSNIPLSATYIKEAS